MKKIKLFVWLFVMFFVSEALAQDKTIYITLDVSGSMSYNHKYDYANYAAQVLAVLNKDKKVILIVGAKPVDISGNSYKKIQKYFNTYHTEIEDIATFNRVFDKSIPGQELFIIGDGKWDDKKFIKEQFKDLVESGNLRVTFLETLVDKRKANTDFEKFLNKYNLAKIYQTDNSKSLIKSINTIVEEISGVKSLTTKEYKVDGKCIEFKTVFNLKNIMFLYQDASAPRQLPQIKSVTLDGNKIGVEFLGQPTTASFASKSGYMSSNIFRINGPIKAGSEIRVCFDKKIDASKLKIFPMIDAGISGISIVTDDTKTEQIDVNTVAVCKKAGTAKVGIKFSQGGNNLSQEALDRTEVYVIANGRRYKAKYDSASGTFVAEIPLKSKVTKYSIESVIGYKRINSGQKKIIKNSKCEPKIPPLQQENLPEQQVGTFNLEKAGCDNSFIIHLLDKDTNIVLNPEQFDIDVDNNYKYLFKKVEVELTPDHAILLKLKSRGFWCPCFVPDDVTFNFVAKPKQYIDGKRYRELHVPLTVKIDKTGQSWMQRCGWLLYSLLGSLLLIFFLIKLSKKRRFRKGAKIILKAPSAQTLRSLYPKYIENGFRLRKKGFLAWLNRWFNPFVPENKTQSFSNLGNTTFHYYASGSDNKILFPKSNFDPKKMEYLDYDEASKDKYVKFSKNTELKITHRRVGIGDIDYYIRYDYPEKSWNDIITFRFFISLLIIILVIYVIISVSLLIMSIT